VTNLVDALSQCDKPIQERMVWHFARCDDEFGRRIADGIGLDYASVAG
jgi:catalase